MRVISPDFEPLKRTPRVGLLGAARITPKALVEPAAGLVELASVAARDLERARVFAAENGIFAARGSYEELIDDPSIDLVYVALPAALHLPWTLRALEAGKHVLVEKPFGLDRAECELAVETARRERRFLAEAQHSRLHPLRAAFAEALGRVGRIERVDLVFVGSIAEGDIRLDPRLGAGVMTDFGCYLVEWADWFGEASWSVESANAVEQPRGVDRTMTAELRGSTSGLAVHLHCDMRDGTAFRAFIDVVGERGRVVFDNPLATAGSSLRVEMTGRVPELTSPGEETTYRRQLTRVVEFLTRGERDVVGEDKIIATQALLDAVYRRAGLPTRKELAQSSGA